MNENIKLQPAFLPLDVMRASNPLISAAFSLLLLFAQLKQTPDMAINPAGLRQTIIEEINLFSTKAKTLQCPPRLILAARYCLCTALDEAILLTPWGSQSGWAQQSLLSFIHRETWGGERFFIILDKMAAEPQKNLPLLELLYLLLAFGYEGKYYNNEDKTLREELQHRLYRLIIAYHPDEGEILSPSVSLLTQSKPRQINRYFNLKFFGSLFGILLSLFVLFNTLIYIKAKPLLQQLTDLEITS